MKLMKAIMKETEITYAGITMPVSKWVEQPDVPVTAKTINRRLRQGMPVAEVLFKPLSPRGQGSHKNAMKVMYKGKRMTVTQCETASGISPYYIRKMHHEGRAIRVDNKKISRVTVRAVKSAVPEIPNIDMLSDAEVRISNLIASGESYESVAKRIRDREIV